MQRKKRKCKKERLLTYPGLVALVFLWQTLKLFGDVKSFWNTNKKFVKLLAHFGSQFFFREESYVNEKRKRNKEKKDNMQFFSDFSRIIENQRNGRLTLVALMFQWRTKNCLVKWNRFETPGQLCLHMDRDLPTRTAKIWLQSKLWSKPKCKPEECTSKYQQPMDSWS